MASRGTDMMLDESVVSVMSSPATAPDAALRWYALASPAESMLLPRREARPFGLDSDEPGPEDFA